MKDTDQIYLHLSLFNAGKTLMRAYANNLSNIHIKSLSLMACSRGNKKFCQTEVNHELLRQGFVRTSVDASMTSLQSIITKVKKRHQVVAPSAPSAAGEESFEIWLHHAKIWQPHGSLLFTAP